MTASSDCPTDAHFLRSHLSVNSDPYVHITEVHRNYVGITFQISNAYKTGIAVENNGFDSLFIFNNDSFHNGCLAAAVLSGLPVPLWCMPFALNMDLSCDSRS